MAGIPYEQFATLLTYPGADLPQQAGRCAEALAAWGQAAQEARAFAAAARALTPARLEEVYSGTFDLSPACCPYMGYHLFGESPKRAVLMVQLKGEYREVGLEVGSELPDHLCLLLRFLARARDEALAADLTTELVAPGLIKMVGGLAGSEANNPYAHALRALLLAVQGEPPVGDAGGAQ
ncbi:MAG: nitrate reductase molybdenum cofactor assembly chaperone [Chloroflexota bacterium]